MFQLNPTFQFDYLLPFAFYEETQSWVKGTRDSWRNNSFQMCVEPDAIGSLPEVNNSIKKIVKNNNPEAHTAEEVFLHPMDK